MAGVFEMYEARKAAGEKLEFDKVTEDELADMRRHHSIAEIAELFGVSNGKVTAKCRRYGIRLFDLLAFEALGKMQECGLSEVMERITRNPEDKEAWAEWETKLQELRASLLSRARE